MTKDQRAGTGQPVWVCIDTIKPEQRDEFRAREGVTTE